MAGNRNRTTFGLVVDRLGVRTTDLARALSADASLVSKWKTGTRTLAEGSVYFDDVVAYLMAHAARDGYRRLYDVLAELYPALRVADASQARRCLRLALSGRVPAPARADGTEAAFAGAQAIPALTFGGAAGRRAALDGILACAEEAPAPGHVDIVDTDALGWLWEDEAYAQAFQRRLLALLDRGFRATIAVRLSASLGEFQRFFDACSSIIFHKNVDWHYVRYYGAPLVGISLVMLDRTVCSVGMCTAESEMTTMVFRDRDVIGRQARFMRDFVGRCTPLLPYFTPFDIPRLVPDPDALTRGRPLIAYLPDPAFIAAERDLVAQILVDNGMSPDSPRFRDVLGLNGFFRALSGLNADGGFPPDRDAVFVFQLEEMVARARRGTVVSRSLSLSCEREIVVQAPRHAAELLSLADQLRHNERLHVVLAKDGEMSLPAMNCWCLQPGMFVQMNSRGFRSCNEETVTSVATAALRQGVQRVPPERRERASVAAILEDLARGMPDAGPLDAHVLTDSVTPPAAPQG